MIAADDFTVENGCPELSPEVWAKKEGVLPGHARVATQVVDGYGRDPTHVDTNQVDLGPNAMADFHKEGHEGFDFKGENAAATPVDQIDQWRHCPMQRGDVLIYDK